MNLNPTEYPIPEGFDRDTEKRMLDLLPKFLGIPEIYWRNGMVSEREFIEAKQRVLLLLTGVTEWEGVCVLSACDEAAQRGLFDRDHYIKLATRILSSGYSVEELLKIDFVKDLSTICWFIGA